jgi:hypothetical protein
VHREAQLSHAVGVHSRRAGLVVVVIVFVLFLVLFVVVVIVVVIVFVLLVFFLVFVRAVGVIALVGMNF